MAVVQLADVIVPEIFTPYVQNLTTEKSRLIASGALATDAAIGTLLAGAGLTFHVPNWRDLANDDPNIPNDDPASKSTPRKTGTFEQIAVRFQRNQSWSTMDLAAVLAGSDPMTSIGNRVAAYWTRQLQRHFVAVVQGVFRNNALATDAFHVKDDMIHDISGSAYVAGVTDFSASAFLDAGLTMGDAQDELTLCMMNSIVYNRAQKNNLIDFIPDARGETNIPTFLGRTVVVDDMVPYANGVAETWLFANGAIRMANGSPKVPTETKRDPDAGNGGGQETLFNRIEMCLHPEGYSYVGTPAAGGPATGNVANGFGSAASWARVYPERKQIKMAKLVTREA